MGTNLISGNQQNENIDDVNLFGTISNYSNFYSNSLQQSQTARTITCAAVSTEDEHYYVYGVSSLGVKFLPSKISVDEYGKFIVSLPKGFWQVTVFAVPSTTVENNVKAWGIEKILENASLVGYTIADLRESSTSVPVRLSADGLSAGASINTKLILSDDGGTTKWTVPSGISSKVRLASLVSGDTITYTDGETLVTGNAVFDANGECSFTPSRKIRPGTYQFEVEFTDRDGNTKGTWSDVILLQPNRTVSNPIYITNVVGVIPLAPSNFTATYVDGGQETENHKGQYKVHFNWDDNSDRENYFELEYIDYSSFGADNLRDIDWVEMSSKITAFDSAYEPLFADGSLKRNSTQLTIYLDLGKKYQARIRSCNSAGKSEWCYVTLPNSIAGLDYSEGTLNPFIYPSGTDAKAIGMFKVEYNLEGGSYWEDDYAAVFDQQTMYYCHDYSTANVLWDGDGSCTTSSLAPFASLKRGMEKFSGWSTSPNGMVNYTKGDNYSDYKNLTLYAVYESGGTLPDTAVEYNLLTNWFAYNLKIDGPEIAVETSSNDCRISTIHVSRDAAPNKNASNLLFSVTVPDNQQFPSMFDGYNLTVISPYGEEICSEKNRTPSSFGNRTPFNGVLLSRLLNGRNDFIFTAYKTINGKKYEYTVTVVVVLED